MEGAIAMTVHAGGCTRIHAATTATQPKASDTRRELLKPRTGGHTSRFKLQLPNLCVNRASLRQDCDAPYRFVETNDLAARLGSVTSRAQPLSQGHCGFFAEDIENWIQSKRMSTNEEVSWTTDHILPLPDVFGECVIGFNGAVFGVCLVEAE